MTIIDRYVFRQTGAALLLILFSLVGVVWIAMALKQLKLVTGSGQDVPTLLLLTTLAVPNLLGLIAPIALLIAAIHILNRLSGDSELIVLTASGSTVWRIARPLMGLALVISALVALISHYVMPWSMRYLREKVTEIRADLITQVLLPGRFSSPMDGITVHIRGRSRDGTLLGVLIKDRRKPETTFTYLAEFGQITKIKDTAFLAMRNGHVIRQDLSKTDKPAPPAMLKFDTYAVDLNQFERKIGPVKHKPRALYFHELLQTEGKSKRDIRKDQTELHERLAGPIYPFVFILVALAFIGQAQSTRNNQNRAIALAFLTAGLIRLSGMAANNVAEKNLAAIPLLYAIPLAAIALLAIGIHLNSYPRRDSKLRRRLDDVLANATSRWSSVDRRSKPLTTGA